jgi:replicative DNA helicase
VLLTYSPSEYNLSAPDGGDLTNVLELIIAKNRYGVEGSVYLDYDYWTYDCKTITPRTD